MTPTTPVLNSPHHPAPNPPRRPPSRSPSSSARSIVRRRPCSRRSTRATFAESSTSTATAWSRYQSLPFVIRLWGPVVVYPVFRGGGVWVGRFLTALEFPDPFHHLRHPAHHSSLQTSSHPTAPLGTPRILADVLEIQRHQAPTGSDDGGRPDPCKYRLRQLMRELPNRGWGKKKKGRAQAFVQTLCSLFCVILYSGPVRTGTVLDLPNHPADDVDGTGVGLRLSPGPPIFEPFAAFLLDGAGFAR
ncbi:hypothetical protein BC936DRAFT_143304 [Jimgerdemannia flammicorona]|uniref:Uncharacterized protein n=1 Tax=Jimgerdemannia flammicorona TaxID=994334 RepID=A0A432ZZA5_9FUNG|nr:hypothetical protein BC936DRAFT_143304 [Jimgerdemannia flammicorona]